MNTSTLNRRARVMLSAITLLAHLVAASAAETNTGFAYLAYRFAPEEGWRVRTSGNAGSTKLEGRVLQFDFTQGASAIGLGLPDRVLLGRPGRIRLHVRGSAKGHPVRVQLRTHFMTFEKVVGEFSGEGEQELAFEAPPGHDWKWFGGENDGKIHGPLRLGEIRFETGAMKDTRRLELVSVAVEGTCPSNRLCMMVASSRKAADQTTFAAELRAASDQPLPGDLQWVVRDWDGNPLAEGNRRVTVPAGGERLAVEVPAGPFPERLKFAEAEFILAIPGQMIPKVQAYWLAPHTPHDMGIMTRDLQPKPAYIAFATLARVLKGMRFAGRLDVTVPEGTFAYRFTPDPKAEGTGRAAPGVASVIALWNPKQSAELTLPVSGSKATLLNTVGEQHVLEVRNGKTKFTVPSGKTVYVQEH